MELPKEEVQPQKLTFQEYINLERENEQKYEYHNGFVIAMAGGAINHSRISGNIFGKLWSLLDKKGGKCEVFNSDTKLKRNSILNTVSFFILSVFLCLKCISCRCWCLTNDF